ncbi:hypothetical protein HDE_00659 [Halotydeus destructor]|nr:hypothetical protein HDE_00659 [Halotydeus destructor]
MAVEAMQPRRQSVSKRYSIQSTLLENLIDDIREKQLDKMAASMTSYHLEDTYEVRANDWFVRRFVLSNRCDRDDSAAALDKCLLWRKFSGVAGARPSDFPKELTNSGLVTFGHDQADNRIIYFRAKVLSHSGLTEIPDLVLKYMMHLVLSLEKSSSGLALVVDMSDISPFKLSEIAILVKLITSSQAYCPLGLKYIWLVDVNWLMKPLLSAVFIREKDQHVMDMMSSCDLVNLIGRDRAPSFFGGSKSLSCDLAAN